MIKNELLGEEISRQLFTVGDPIFNEGELGTHFFIVEKGSVEIFSKDKNGKVIHIADIPTGEIFGEFALIDQRPRSASARAKSDVVLLKVSGKGYERLLGEMPNWATIMLKGFVARLRQMNKQLVEKQFYGAGQIGGSNVKR